MTLAATILLSFLPQVFPGGDLKLPPRTAAAAKATEVRPLEEIERFRRDLHEMAGPRVKVQAKLEEMGRAYPKIEQLILQVARTARSTEMRNLMPVARRFGRTSGTDRVADELLFQLLARPVGSATRQVIDTMAVLKGAKAKTSLKQCMRARIPAVRRHAVPVLAPLCTKEDAAFAMQLSREQSLDLRLRGVDLLEAIGDEAANQRLVALLAKDPALAAAACLALVRVGSAAVPVLLKRVSAPAVDRSYVYAAFALAQIGEETGENVLPAELLEPLAKRLRAPEALTRVLAAVPLADLVYRAAPGEGRELPDAGLVDALLLVVEPAQFVPNIDMLRATAEKRLLRHTGRVIAAENALSWRAWWRDQKDTFLGVRSQLSVDIRNAGVALITLRQEDRTVRIIGEDVATVLALPSAIEVVLTSQQMLALVKALENDGYGNAGAMRVDSALPRVRSLEVRVDQSRSSVAVTESAHFAFDSMVATIDNTIDDELWQLYRVAARDSDRAAFWRAEQKWRAANPSEIDRARHFLGHVLSGWSTWNPEMQARAIGYLVGHKNRKDILREQDGKAIVTTLSALAALGPYDLQLLEVAASSPGDDVWRECVALAVSAEGGGRKAVTQVFKVLGPDAVLSALKDDRPLVRRAALDEVVSVRDVRAAPSLIRLLQDEDFDVQRAAVFACGHLKVSSASRPLVELIAAEDTDPTMRRECLRAIGSVGGQLAFPVLEQAMASRSLDDKAAALRGLGELRDPRAAHLLAEFVVVGYGKDFGNLAKFHLQRHGAPQAVPALRRQIPLVADVKIRAELVLLLGLYQDPKNVPDLMDLLRNPNFAARTVSVLEGSTGVNLKAVPDRITAIEGWWRVNKDVSQWQWLLDGLSRAQVPTTLTLDDFASDAGMSSVPELARLMVDVEQPRLWVLCSAVLRAITKKDYGVVSEQTPPDKRLGFAGRYRLVAEAAAADKK
ncbi:MAG: HEAT repeat protein [Planctomycetota bacterium]|jgi:HEAT repeat protein